MRNVSTRTPSSSNLYGSTTSLSAALYGSTPLSPALYGSTPPSPVLYGSTLSSPVPHLYSLSTNLYRSPTLLRPNYRDYRSTYSSIALTSSFSPTPSSVAPTPSSVAPTPSSVALTPSSVAPTPSSVAPTPSSVALHRSTPSNVDRADHTNTYSNVSYPNPSDDAPDVSTTLCGWVDEHGSVCGEPITYDCVTHLATAHGISKMSPRTRVNCRWCSPPRRMTLENMLRHVREVHLRCKRSRISENKT